jgi:hypothetical protein
MNRGVLPLLRLITSWSGIRGARTPREALSRWGETHFFMEGFPFFAVMKKCCQLLKLARY